MLEHALPRESRNAFTEDSPVTPVMKFRLTTDSCAERSPHPGS